MTFRKNVQWHKKQSRTALSRYKSKHLNAPVSAYEFKKLERQVRKNIAEKHTLRINDAQISQIGTSWEQANVDITGSVKAYSLFREHVLGDKFKFCGFNIRMITECTELRCILYRAHRTNNILDMTAFISPTLGMYDPSIVKAVYFDKTYIRDVNGNTRNPDKQWVLNISKKLNFTQLINSDNADVTENTPLRMLVIARGAVGDQTNYSWEATYQNV